MSDRPQKARVSNKSIVAAAAILGVLGAAFAAFEHFWRIPQMIDAAVKEKIDGELKQHMDRAKAAGDVAEGAAAAAQAARATAVKDAGDTAAAKGKAEAALTELERSLEQYRASARSLADRVTTAEATLKKVDEECVRYNHRLTLTMPNLPHEPFVGVNDKNVLEGSYTEASWPIPSTVRKQVEFKVRRND